jgi:hypothetical protein
VDEASEAVKHLLEASTAERSGPAVRTMDYVNGFGSIGGLWMKNFQAAALLAAFVGSFDELAVDERRRRGRVRPGGAR